MRSEELGVRSEELRKKPSPRGEGGSADAESDEGLSKSKDHLNKENEAFLLSSVDIQPHRILRLCERLSPHPSPVG